MVLPAGMSLHYRLDCLPTQIREVVAHGVHHGATGALTAAHLCLWHKIDLRRVEPGFLAAEEIPSDVDVGWLIAKYSGNANAVGTIVSAEQIIKDAPL